MRSRETYMHAVDLGNGATFSDLPASFNERLLRHIVGVWAKRGDERGTVLKVSGSEALAELGDLSAADPEIISGTLPDLAAWSCGRASTAVVSSRRENPVPPHWQ
jgi:maleylpyruvate isomerase